MFILVFYRLEFGILGLVHVGMLGHVVLLCGFGMIGFAMLGRLDCWVWEFGDFLDFDMLERLAFRFDKCD